MKKILVAGDSILDKFYQGTVERISPEAPAMVFDITSENTVLGGACNVAANIRTLSGLDQTELKIDYLGWFSPVISELFSELYDIKCVGSQDKDSFILSKKRYIIGNNHQLLRVDNKKKYASCIDQDCFPLDKGYDLIVISDYNKNSLDDYWDKILNYKAPILFDLKELRFGLKKELEKNSSKCIIKCNEKEILNNKILDTLKPENYKGIVETRGAKGYMLYSSASYHYGLGINVGDKIDPTGAGDVFLAGMAVKMLETEDLKEICDFGNKAASEKVKHEGTFCVKRKLII